MYAKEIDTAIQSLIDSMRKSMANGETDIGGTVSLIGAPVPEDGFMVGGFTGSLIFGKELLDHGDVAWQMITRFVNKHFALATSEGTFLGGWIDNEDGYVYIDISRRYDDETEARLQAHFNNEIAIWDLGKGEEIRIK